MKCKKHALYRRKMSLLLGSGRKEQPQAIESLLNQTLLRRNMSFILGSGWAFAQGVPFKFCPYRQICHSSWGGVGFCPGSSFQVLSFWVTLPPPVLLLSKVTCRKGKTRKEKSQTTNGAFILCLQDALNRGKMSVSWGEGGLWPSDFLPQFWPCMWSSPSGDDGKGLATRLPGGKGCGSFTTREEKPPKKWCLTLMSRSEILELIYFSFWGEGGPWPGDFLPSFFWPCMWAFLIKWWLFLPRLRNGQD